MPLITKLSFQKNQKRVNVFLDGSFAFGLTASLALKRHLKVGDQLSQLKISKLLIASWQEELYEKSLNFLTFRPRSQKEITDYLKRKIYSLKKKNDSRFLTNEIDFKQLTRTLIDKILKRLQKNKFVDDLEFSKWFIGQRLKFRPRGKYGLQMELKAKGISSETINQALADEKIFSSKKEMTAAKEIAEKAWYKWLKSNHQNLTREITLGFKQRLYRRLHGLGFAAETVKVVIDDLPLRQ